MTTTEPSPPATVNTAALRLARTPGDMAKAVLVLLVPVALLVALYVFFFGGNNVIQIDPSGSYADARAAANFTVLQPVGLSTSWKPVSSQFDPGKPATLRVGYVAPDGGGIQLIETDQAADKTITAEVGAVGAVATGVQIGDRTWGLLHASSGGNLALVDTEADRTVLVIGPVTESDLRTFVTSLR